MEQQIRVLVGALLSSVFATTTMAADIAVQPDGQGLQATLEQARCGDTIRLQAGIYQ
jgi:hypothetical protein